MDSSRESERKDPAEGTPLRAPRARTPVPDSPPRADAHAVHLPDNKDSTWVGIDEVPDASPPHSHGTRDEELDNVGMDALPAPQPSVEHAENREDAPRASEALRKASIMLRSKRPKSNAELGCNYFRQVMQLLEKKHRDIMFFEEIDNHTILHLDWASEVDDNQETDDSRKNKSVDRSDIASNLEWGKAMFFGDWLYSDNGQREYYIEVQIKHVSGEDDEVIRNLGINPNQVWTGMGLVKGIDSKLSSVKPKRSFLSSLASKHSGFQSSSEESDNEELKDDAALALTNMKRRRPLPSTPTKASPSADKTRGGTTPKTVHVGSEDTDLRGPTAAGSSPGLRWNPFSSSRRTTANSNSEQGAAAGPSTDQAPSSPRSGFARRFGSRSPQPGSDRPAGTGIPRSKPLVPHSTSFDSIDDDGDTIMSDETVEAEDNGGGDTTQSEIVIPGTPSLTPSPSSSPINYLSDSDNDQAGESSASKENQNPRDTRRSQGSRDLGHDNLSRVCTPDLDDSFAARKKRSSIYTVRVVAFSIARSQNENGFTGPPSSQRQGTLLGHGGWVAPPFEERVAKWKANYGHLPLSCSAIPEHERKLHDPPRTRCRALPVKFDYTIDDPPRYYGEPAPVWWELGDPCLDDVYWMFWQLLTGRQYIGFKRGSGFGFPRTNTSGDDALLARCPFKSPSGEATIGSMIKGECIRQREISPSRDIDMDSRKEKEKENENEKEE
ncbi:hypothetical protein B0T20DRAFT_473019 [Sordaria brevicollis]|uniref:Uncharacterized protein n=1 Tax=Sordaria brevicollis TaxID=83679 RepID=A0AAE0P118_SORBR|nr:hypothetical protein B0T20DRAFT_473019 [Sordaria brevicollis]